MDKDNSQSNGAEMDYIADLVGEADSGSPGGSTLARDEVVFLGEAESGTSKESGDDSGKLAQDEVVFLGEPEAATESTEGAAQSGALSLDLPARVSIKDIHGLKESLSSDWSEHESLLINAGEVDSIDTASIQLLVAAINSAKANDVKVGWSGVSEKLKDLASIVDLTRFLDLDSVVDSDSGAAESEDDLVPVF